MKKTIFFIWFLFITKTTFWFDYTCFENAWEIKNVQNNTIIVSTNELNNYYFQDDKLLNTKLYQNYDKKYYSYINLENWLNYQNWSVKFDQYQKNKSLTIKFKEKLLKNTFNYDFVTDNYSYHFEISNDWKNYFKIEDDIKNYDLEYLKIVFDNKDLKNTNIYELGFYNLWKAKILVNSLSNSDIKVYNNYECYDDNLSKIINTTQKTQYFPIDVNTKTYELTLSKNQNFKQTHITDYLNKDSDNDWIIDTKDNCKNDYNPNQLDSTASWIWDICSDKDDDDILWNVDNCPTLYNPEQIDENKNGIWDVCEADKDWDKIFDTIDNCELVSNFDQLDSDFDWVWDSCDNCNDLYNPNQKDVDKDKIWDSCDKKDDRYIESNKTFFTVLIITIIVLFLWLIYGMIRKLKNMWK